MLTWNEIIEKTIKYAFENTIYFDYSTVTSYNNEFEFECLTPYNYSYDTVIRERPILF